MNKISKKIVALVTMAAFVLTLVPAAAFATPGKVDGSKYTVNQTAYNTVDITVNVTNTDRTEAQNVVVWAQDADGNVAEATYVAANTDTELANIDTEAAPQWKNTAIINNTKTSSKITYKVTATFAQAGDYTVYAAVNEQGAGNLTALEGEKLPATGQVNTVAIYDLQSAQQSAITVAEDSTDVNTNEDVTATFAVKDSAGVPGEGSFDVLQNVKVWATTKNANSDTVVSDAVTFYTTDGTPLTRDNETYKTAVPGNVLNGDKIVAKFAAGGEYTICASAYDPQTGKDKDLAFSAPVTVTAPATSVDSITFTGNADTTVEADNVAENGETVDVATTIIANGLATGTLTATVRDNNGNLMDGQEFTLTAPKAGIELDKTTVKTDSKGQFTIKYTLEQAGPFKVYVESGSFSVTLNLTKAYDQSKYTIKNTTKDATALLAGNDPNYDKNTPDDFSSAVQFTIGNGVDGTVTGDPLHSKNATAFPQDEPAALSDTDYISVKVPDGSKLKAEDLKLVWNSSKECYTVAYIGKNPTVDLIPGEYTVSVGLLSGDTASATFTVAKFGEVTGLALDMNDKTTGASVTDQVNLGATVEGTVKYVDANGIAIKATNSDLAVGISGSAHNFVTTKNTFEQNGIEFSFTANSDEKYVGSTITLKAVDAKKGLRNETVLTIVDPYADKTLAFDSNEGDTNKNNTVEVSVVDEDGNLANTVSGQVYAYVESQSNDDAKVSVDVPATGVVKGTADITVYSSAKTTAKIVVAVKDNKTDNIYGATLDYTFGEPDKYADTSVVMTIGSTDYIVNNDIVKGDAAPYVNGDYRTMVPIRALSEALGAEVDYENNVVTIVDGDTTIVMNIGEKDYTINGEAADPAMDTAPVIGEGDRTYVPVRFVAEALGYDVTALYNSNGLTASVVFQK